MIYTNKIISLIITYLNIKNNKSYTLKIVKELLLKIKNTYGKSPIFFIEKALFNIMVPIKYNKTRFNPNKYNISIVGVPLKECLYYSIISIINRSKLENYKSISEKLFVLFIKIYKKEHQLFNDKYYYLNKLLQK